MSGVVGPGTCAVLGAGPGLGAALARRFGRAGHPVAVVAREPGALDALVVALAADGIDASAFPADLADGEVAPGLVASITDRMGPIEVLCYNAARLGWRARATTVDLDELRASLELDVVSALAATQQVVPAMRARGRGTVLLTGGTFALTPSADFAPIGLGKAALRNLTYALADELGPEGIHVATVTIGGRIAPGTSYDPDRLAEVFWALHQQPRGAFETEVIV